MLGIIGAMDQEVAEIKNQMTDVTVERLFRGCRYHIHIRHPERRVLVPHVEGRAECTVEI